MLKFFLSIVLTSSILLSATLAKPTGCDLSQDGDVSLSIQGYANSPKANYTPIQKVGKNFKELFVGSTISLDEALLRIDSISSNKRVKGKPRTGYIGVTLKLKGKNEKIKMSYAYSEGYFQALGKQKSGKKISFALSIKALLCYSK